MIGQKTLKQTLVNLLKNDSFPRFVILVGETGSGRKTLVHEVFDCLITEYEIGIDGIRQMIAEAHRMSGVPSVYLIPDADTMSVQAKNALLKVTEEPPRNAYVIMTLSDLNNTLDTIKSRATVFQMEQYSPQEITQYSEEVYGENNDIYRDLCSTPGEVDLLYSFGAEDFYEYVRKVAQNISEVSLANALKISSQLAIKDNGGYDLGMFWKAFLKASMDMKDYQRIQPTTQSLSRLKKIKGINKQMLFDTWLFDIRSIDNGDSGT